MIRNQSRRQQIKASKITHSKAVISEGCIALVFLVELFLAHDGMFNKVDCQRRYDGVEIPQMHVLRLVELRLKHVYQKLETNKHFRTDSRSQQVALLRQTFSNKKWEKMNSIEFFHHCGR